MNGSSQQLALKKVGVRSAMGKGLLITMMPFHLHIYQKSDYDDDERTGLVFEDKVSNLILKSKYSKICLQQPLKKNTKNWFSKLIIA